MLINGDIVTPSIEPDGGGMVTSLAPVISPASGFSTPSSGFKNHSKAADTNIELSSLRRNRAHLLLTGSSRNSPAYVSSDVASIGIWN